MSSSSTSSISVVSNISSSEFFSTKANLPKIFIKLASTNYLFQKVKVVPVLLRHGLFGYVTNEVPRPPNTIADENGVQNPNPAASMWLRIDQLIMRWINISLSDILLSQVINCETVSDAWEALETLYGRHTCDRVQQMRGELQVLTKGTSSMEEYLHKAKALALSLCGARKLMDDEDFIICLLQGLGPEFDLIVAAINARDNFPALENVISKLRDFDIRLSSSRNNSTSTIALNTTRNTSFKQRGGLSSRARGRNQNSRARGNNKSYEKFSPGRGQ